MTGALDRRSYSYNIADNSIVGIGVGNAVGESTGRSEITKDEFACLLMLFAEDRELKFTRFGLTVYLKIDRPKTAIPYGSSLPKFERLSDVQDVSIQWNEIVDTMLGRTTSTNKTTNGIHINVYGDKDCLDYHSSFTFYINCRSGKESGNTEKTKYFINANCAPTQLLSGDNSVPFMSMRSAREKANFFAEMFTLPFFILSDLINTYVLRKDSKPCPLTRDTEKFNNSIMKMQFADYCKKLPSYERRNLLAAILGDTYMHCKVRANGQGVSIRDSLKFAVEDKDSKRVLTKYGEPIARTGFLLKFTSGDRPTFSLGFYNKDHVTDEQQKKALEKGYSKKKVSKHEAEIDAFTRQSIRLDLSIHTAGIVKLSSELSKAYDSIDYIGKIFKTNDVRKFLEQCLTVDPSLSMFYKFVLEEEMHIEQMLRVTTKQWDKAWELLKEKGLTDLIEPLKRRRNLVGNDDSFTSIVRKFCGKKIDPLRLRREIREKTVLFKRDAAGEIVKQNGQPVVLCGGVDLRFPYYVKLQVDEILRDSFKDLERNRALAETGRIPNDYDLVALHKTAVRAGRELARVLSYGNNLEPIPVFKK